jgi:hypothetical protein
MNVDPIRSHDYDNTSGEIAAVKSMRLRNFIIRHNMLYLFIREDEQGKR